LLEKNEIFKKEIPKTLQNSTIFAEYVENKHLLKINRTVKIRHEISDILISEITFWMRILIIQH